MASLALLTLGLTLGATSASPNQSGDRADDPQAARGEYLAAVGSCEGCHSGPAGRFAGGRTFKTSFGVVGAANITPDAKTGIGAWSSDDFYRALHEGHSRKVGDLYPAFPYPHYTRVTRADSDAIFAYLHTVEPVANNPRRNGLEFPFSIRAVMGLWNGLFFHKGEFAPTATASDEWNRGAYIVQGLGHCGDCHTPKNAFQAEQRSHALQGGVVEGWFGPDLTPEPRAGLGSWSQTDITDFLATGRNRFTVAGGPMANVVAGSTSKMTEADRRAIAIYLKSLPASATPTASAPDPKALDRGKQTYGVYCASCHGEDGAGGSSQLAPLAGNPITQSRNPATDVRYVLAGMQSAVTPAYPQRETMPGFGDKLSDAEVADVVTYMRNAWGNRGATVTASQVAKLRSEASETTKADAASQPKR